MKLQTLRTGVTARTQLLVGLKCRSTQSPNVLPSAQPLRRLSQRQRFSRTTVAAVDTEKPTVEGDKPEIAKVADSIGLPTSEGLFGFKPFSEVWVGRLAMAGFLVSVVEEFWTGKGTLQQIGLSTPSVPLAAIIGILGGGATLLATGNTLVKAQSGQMEPQQLERYKSFLGIQPDAEIDAEADALKRKGDFTSPDSYKDIAEAKAEGTPADRFLNRDGEESEANQAARELKEQEQRSRDADKKGPSLSLASRADVVEQTTQQAAEWRYARQVEITNGRWAMIGFFACIIIEALTGRGIIGQVILYLKALNILGPQSGF